MKTINKNTPISAVVQQVINNATSWIGHRRDNDDVISGQTFIAPAEGDLAAIEIFSALVTKPGKVIMTLHNFDRDQKCWGPALKTTSINIKSNEAGRWLAFDMPGMHLDKGASYGFRIQSPDTLIGVGEAAGNLSKPPFSYGQEWQFTNEKSEGKCFSYFSLAFKVDMKAA
ncbi:MAG TPA: hypothetical protein PLY34_04545 [Ferruginibacter sp.]|nr:hypothetical protein [Ferruginibacter sp.]HPH90441.1 hypothetical protein [Ferruginibacter sp.]